jgi:hypothetical protein
MSNKSIIRLIEHPHAISIYQARKDFAAITNTKLVERPYWYENTETGQLYHDLYACIGYPTEVTEKDEGMMGYSAIVAVLRTNETLSEYNPVNANFQLLAEFESKDVQTLLSGCIEMRQKYGFGIAPDFLNVWYGNPDRFVTTLALRNDELTRQGGENNAMLVTPPMDLYADKPFDNYIRSLKSCMLKERLRFYFGECNILKNCLREFRAGNPAVMAIGGLIHSLLAHCSWMSPTGKGVYSIDDDVKIA